MLGCASRAPCRPVINTNVHPLHVRGAFQPYQTGASHKSQTVQAQAVRGLLVCAASCNASAPSRYLIVVAAAADSGDAAQETASTPLSEPELKQLWDSVTRALLKLGKPGVTESHAASLSELAGSHKLVKVQLNGARDDPAAVATAAAQLEQHTAGAVQLLQIKGTTMLFSSSSSNREQLLAVAEASAAGTAAWKLKRQAAAAERQQQRAVAEAKRDSNASRSRKRIGQMISTVAKPSKGPIDKATLAEEWQQLAAGITAEEAAAEAGGSQQGSRRRTPWKK